MACSLQSKKELVEDARREAASVVRLSKGAASASPLMVFKGMLHREALASELVEVAIGEITAICGQMRESVKGDLQAYEKLSGEGAVLLMKATVSTQSMSGSLKKQRELRAIAEQMLWQCDGCEVSLYVRFCIAFLNGQIGDQVEADREIARIEEMLKVMDVQEERQRSGWTVERDFLAEIPSFLRRIGR